MVFTGCLLVSVGGVFVAGWPSVQPPIRDLSCSRPDLDVDEAIHKDHATWREESGRAFSSVTITCPMSPSLYTGQGQGTITRVSKRSSHIVSFAAASKVTRNGL